MTTTFINGVRVGSGMAHFREQQVANTAGGTFTTGAWRTRTLNTTVNNTINGASLASDLITLPAGVYEIVWNAPAHQCGVHISRLFNTTTSAQVALSSVGRANSGVAVGTLSIGRIFLTLTALSALRLEHNCGTTRATDGFGLACNLDSQPEIFSEVWVKQL